MSSVIKLKQLPLYHILIIQFVLLSHISYGQTNGTNNPIQPSSGPTLFYPPSTIHPSSSPTIKQCNTQYGDGIDINPMIPSFPSIKYHQNSSINTQNTNNIYIGSNFTCSPNGDNMGCLYECIEDGSCLKSTISCDSNSGCNIRCSGYYSCASMAIYSSLSSISSVVTIKCDGQFACNDMRINAISFKQINVHCITENSCNAMNIIINNTNTISSISCYDVNACDDIYYYSLSIQSKLSMYAYSTNIIAQNINDIECMDDEQFIIYSKNTTFAHIEDEITNKYKISNGNPPCAGITEICGNYSCNTQYTMKQIDVKYTDKMTENDCYYVPISAVTDRSCDKCDATPITSNIPLTTNKETSSGFFWFIFFLMVICSILSCCAYAYNLYPKSSVDNARFYVPIMIGLQICNFYSDINLCCEIFNKSSFNNNIFIILSGLGVLSFILLSYLINMILAKQIRSIIRNNIAFKYYFRTEFNRNTNRFNNNKRYILFVLIMIFTGSSWYSLLLLSSQIFTINIFNAGLTFYDLMQLIAGPKSFYFISSYTIFGCFPQIFFQFLYCIAIDEITFAVSIAFISSIITLILFILFYIFEKQKQSFYETVEYYLEMNAVSKREFDKNQHYMFEYQRLIMNKKERKSELLSNIKTVFGTENQHNIEIGYTSLTTYGCITHFISRIDHNDMGPRALKEEELKNLNNDDSTFYNLASLAHKFINNIYIQNMDHITEVFRSHYGVDIHIKITYHSSYPLDQNDEYKYGRVPIMAIEMATISGRYKQEKNNNNNNISNKIGSSTLSPSRIITLSPSPKGGKTGRKSLRLRRTQSNPVELDQLAFNGNGGKKNIPHVRLVESDDEYNGGTKVIYSPGAESSDSDQFNDDEEGNDVHRRSSDTSDEHIDYAGLCIVESPTKTFKPSPRSPFGPFGPLSSMGGSGNNNNNNDHSLIFMGLGGRTQSLSLNAGKSNVRVLYRYDGWPEAEIINIYKFNQNSNGMNVREIIQQIEMRNNEEIEYEQLRYATNPTYIHGKRGWKETFKNSFIPFLIGEDGCNEVDIWFRTKQFIHNGVGKQLK